ncbi:hypothetical protein Tamer19_72600 [Cupriavidus sp. TA19]|uniref:hypothetical protein n=1 Tax=Cupriavidus sp. TA19 TaxID=701108 RepID=UPI002729448D|nr:hypothetical protein [Cupriavidus sp. TA19]GLC97851.1 hypothetical protein Tamer19_72600 [Cupriavidus sp. TA19]
MDLTVMNVPGGTGGALGFIVAAIGGAIWFIRSAWRKDRVEGAQSQAEIDIIARLSEQLDKANARAALAEQRADLAYKERNEAYQAIGKLEAEISALKMQVQMMRERFDGKAT